MMWQSFKSKTVHLHAQASIGTFLSTDKNSRYRRKSWDMSHLNSAYFTLQWDLRHVKTISRILSVRRTRIRREIGMHMHAPVLTRGLELDQNQELIGTFLTATDRPARTVDKSPSAWPHTSGVLGGRAAPIRRFSGCQSEFTLSSTH